MPDNPSRATPRMLLGLVALLLSLQCQAATPEEATNKALARQFYEQLWFSRHPAIVDTLVAPEYVAHDIGDRKGVTEPADEQKQIAEFLWRNGEMDGRIDYQIAEGDLVATRWQWQYRPTSWWMKLMMLGGAESVPIINVFRFRDGRIVEIWNHRHDIDIGYAANTLVAKGFVAGVVATLIMILGLRLLRRWRQA